MIEPISKPKPQAERKNLAKYTAKVMTVRYKMAFEKLYLTALPATREELDKKLDTYRTRVFAKEVTTLAESDSPLNLK